MLRLAASLALGSASVAFAQMDYDITNRIPLASVGWGPQEAISSSYVGAAAFTNRPALLGSVPRPKRDPESLLTYAGPPSQPSGESASYEPSFTGKIQLDDQARTRPVQRWRIGDGGVLGYTTPSKRWHFLFRYQPDLSAFREDFDQLHAFSLIWQYSLGRHKLAGWTGAPVPDLFPRRPPPGAGSGLSSY